MRTKMLTDLLRIFHRYQGLVDFELRTSDDLPITRFTIDRKNKVVYLTDENED